MNVKGNIVIRVSLFVTLLFALRAEMPAQWIRQSNAPWAAMRSTSFVDARTGIGCGSNGILGAIYSTADSGVTWSMWTPDTIYNEDNGLYGLRSVALSATGLGWAVGPRGVFQTTDYGKSWSDDSLALPESLRSGLATTIWSIVSVSDTWAFISGCRDGKTVLCRRTLSIDSTWQRIALLGEQNCAGYGPKEEDSYVDGAMSRDGIGFLTIRADTLFATSDSGYTWGIRSRIRESIPTISDAKDIFFLDSLNGWIVNSFHYTRDGGRTWTTRNESGVICSTVCFVDTLCGWIADDYGVEMTTNGGRSWIRQIQGGRSRTLEVVDDSLIYSLGTRTFWKADYRSLCDSTASGIRDVDVNHEGARSSVIGNLLTIDLVGLEIADQVSVHVSDLLGRSVAIWAAQDVSSTNQLMLDFPQVECGVYLISVYSGSNISGSMVTYCN